MNQYLKLYEKSNNPLENNEILEKVIKAYISYKKTALLLFIMKLKKQVLKEKNLHHHL